jgi:hypothetical protein
VLLALFGALANPKLAIYGARRFNEPELAIDGAHGLIFFSALAFGDFLAIHTDIDRCLDADADLRAVDGHHRHFDVFTDS